MRRSGLTSSTVRMTSSNCVTSPRTTGAPTGTPANVAAPGFRSMPTTDSPRATSFRMSRGPMNPVAPTTRMDIANLLSRGAPAMPGRLRVSGGLGGPQGPPMRSILLGGLPGDHSPVRAGLRVDGEVPDREAILLAVSLDVHVRHAVDDADTAVNAHAPVARRDAPVVRLAGAQVRDVLGLRLLPSGGVHVDQVVRERGVEPGPVALAHRLEAPVVGAKNLGLDPGQLRRHRRHGSLLVWVRLRSRGDRRGSGASAVRGNDVLAEHLDGRERALVRDGLGLRDQDDLIDAGLLVQLYAADAAVRVAGDDDAAVAQGVGVHLAERGPRGARAAVERDADLRRLLLVRGVGLPEPPAEVGLQVVGHAAPRLEQLLVGIHAVADVGLVRAEERLERQG